MKTFRHEEDPPLFSHFKPTHIRNHEDYVIERLQWIEDDFQPATFMYDNHRWIVIGEDPANRTQIIRRLT